MRTPRAFRSGSSVLTIRKRNVAPGMKALGVAITVQPVGGGELSVGLISISGSWPTLQMGDPNEKASAPGENAPAAKSSHSARNRRTVDEEVAATSRITPPDS
jgi:hypothetical protein